MNRNCQTSCDSDSDLLVYRVGDRAARDVLISAINADLADQGLPAGHFITFGATDANWFASMLGAEGYSVASWSPASATPMGVLGEEEGRAEFPTYEVSLYAIMYAR